MSAKTRPPLLSLLAALAGIVGVVTLALALMRLGGAGDGPGILWLDALLALLLGSFLVVAAVGLYLGKPWGRVSGSGAFGLAALLQLVDVLGPAFRDEYVRTYALSLRALALALLVSVLVYLNTRPATEWLAPKSPTGPGAGSL